MKLAVINSKLLIIFPTIANNTEFIKNPNIKPKIMFLFI